MVIRKALPYIVAALALLTSGCSSDPPSGPPLTRAGDGSTVTPSSALDVAEVARVTTPHASFVSVSGGRVAWASTASTRGTPDRVVVYELDTGLSRTVVDVSRDGGVVDIGRLTGDLLVHGEQYPKRGPESGDLTGPWRIIGTDLKSGESWTIAHDDGSPEDQTVNVSFDVDDARVLWVVPAGRTPDGFDLWSLRVADLDGGNARAIGPPGEYVNATLAAGRVIVAAPSSPTTIDAFELDESNASLRQLTKSGNVNRVAPANDDFFVVEENRSDGLYLVKVPFDPDEEPVDFGGRSSNVAVGDGFALWYPWDGSKVVLAPLANTAAHVSPVPRGRPDVPARTAAHGDIAVWGEGTGPGIADPVDVVVVRVSLR